MILWLDAQLSPLMAIWIEDRFSVQAVPLRAIGLRDATDQEIFASARGAGAIGMSKDSDFVDLVVKHGAPPQVLWLTCGNTSNASLKRMLTVTLSSALELLRAGEPLVEIGDSG